MCKFCSKITHACNGTQENTSAKKSAYKPASNTHIKNTNSDDFDICKTQRICFCSENMSAMEFGFAFAYHGAAAAAASY